ncbi:MAG: hypothetical protein DRP72_03620 [Candidatus Omnitrophota bacterium]|nr:MAG: hypothetical protein DRP72_03620 [Candidatus Omnitrophota bacterium]
MKKINLDTINSMNGYEFENLIGELLKKMEFTIKQTQKTADGGIDIFVYSNEPITGGTYIIQCKRHNSPISEPVIRELYGVVISEKANKGILITNSTFTKTAEKFAKDKPLELINGNKLIDLLNKYFDIDVNASRVQISPYYKFLFEEVIKIIDDLENKYNAIKNGLVFAKGRYINTVQGYLNFITKELSDFLSMLNIFENLMNSFGKQPSNDNFAINESVTPIVENFNSFIKEFFSGWKKIYFVRYPEGCEKITAAFLEMYDEIFQLIFLLRTKIIDSMNNPEKYEEAGLITIDLPSKNDVINNNSKIIENEFKRLLKKSRCFIATACYGYHSDNVIILEQFRDHFLLKNKIGEVIVKLYYKLSPKIALKIEKDILLKTLIRIILQLIIFLLTNLLKINKLTNKQRKI